ncbi:MAG: hypothetical protein Q9Q13_04555 [Acidobacteriota bacterium]|nr:hypothetical protein [Acidobacteriota bacterium]
MADAATCFISPTRDVTCDRLAPQLASLAESKATTLWLALGGHVFVGPGGRIERPARSLRRAAGRALIRRGWHAVVADSSPWLLQGRLAPGPVCLCVRTAEPSRAATVVAPAVALLEQAADDDPLFAVKCTTPSLWSLLSQIRPLAASTLPLLLRGGNRHRQGSPGPCVARRVRPHG